MSRDDQDYYRARAIEEHERAQSSERANVREIHEELARLYEALAEQADLRPTLSIRTASAR